MKKLDGDLEIIVYGASEPETLPAFGKLINEDISRIGDVYLTINVSLEFSVPSGITKE